MGFISSEEEEEEEEDFEEEEDTLLMMGLSILGLMSEQVNDNINKMRECRSQRKKMGWRGI